MLTWIQLLTGGVVLGASVVVTMAAPRRYWLLGPLLGVIGLVASLAAFGSISREFATPQAIGVGLLFLVVGTAAGYGLAAATLPALAHRRPVARIAATGDHEGAPSVVLLACADTERYSPRAVAARGNELAEGDAIRVPVAVLPLVFSTERARYRAAGGRSPAYAVVQAIAARLAEAPPLAERRPDVHTAWCYSPPSLAHVVAECARNGSRTIAVVALGSVDAEPVDRARAELAGMKAHEAGTDVVFGPSVWNHRGLPDRLAERVLAAAQDGEYAATGVVLVSAGVPTAWVPHHLAAASEENYFNQRVRLLLSEAEIDERMIRIAWLDWQLPDVTESIRHVVALGATRVIVAPSTIALPTISTGLDIRQAVDLARVPAGVESVVLPAWGDDDVFVEAVAASAEHALALGARPATP